VSRDWLLYLDDMHEACEIGVDHEILWDIVRNKVPPLLDVIRSIGAAPGGSAH
jgi:hypothetical protein